MRRDKSGETARDRKSHRSGTAELRRRPLQERAVRPTKNRAPDRLIRCSRLRSLRFPRPKLRARVRRHVVQSGLLAELQHAYISGNGPAVARIHLRGVIRHEPETVGHDVVEIAVGHLSQAVNMKRWRTAQPAAHNHAQAVAQAPMARRAIYIEALLAAIEHRACDRKRNVVDKILA